MADESGMEPGCIAMAAESPVEVWGIAMADELRVQVQSQMLMSLSLKIILVSMPLFE